MTQIAQTELLAELNPSFYARTGIRVGFTFGMGIFHTHLERDSQICILCDAASLFFVFKYCIFCLMGRHPLVGCNGAARRGTYMPNLLRSVRGPAGLAVLTQLLQEMLGGTLGGESRSSF